MHEILDVPTNENYYRMIIMHEENMATELITILERFKGGRIIVDSKENLVIRIVQLLRELMISESESSTIFQRYLDEIKISVADIKDARNWTIAHHAATQYEVGVIKLLLNLREADDLSIQQTKDGLTILHIAVSWHRLDIVEYLLERPNITILSMICDNNQCTALHSAVTAYTNGNTEIIECFLQLPNIQELVLIPNRFGETVLHCAVEEEFVAAVKLLLQLANAPKLVLMQTKSDLWTPLHIALSQGHLEIENMLLEVPNISDQCQCMIPDSHGRNASYWYQKRDLMK